MRKTIKFVFMALGAGMLSTGCSRGGESGVPDDNRGKVVGTYPVKVSVESLPVGLNLDLAVTEEGDSDLRVTGAVEVPVIGEVSIDFVLSELKEYCDEGGRAVNGYLFKIAAQESSILGMPVMLKGTGAYAQGYDGKLYVGATGPFISFEVDGAAAQLTIQLSVNSHR